MHRLQQQRQQDVDQEDAFEAPWAMLDQRERRIQEELHERQIAKIRDALTQTRLQGPTQRQKNRRNDREDLGEALNESGTEYSDRDFDANFHWEQNRNNMIRKRSSDLKPRKPRLLKSVDKIARIRAFIH